MHALVPKLTIAANISSAMNSTFNLFLHIIRSQTSINQSLKPDKYTFSFFMHATNKASSILKLHEEKGRDNAG